MKRYTAISFALAITGLASTAATLADNAPSDTVLLAQATPAPKANEPQQSPPTPSDKGASPTNTATDAAPSHAMGSMNDDKEMANQMQMMGKRMQQQGMDMEKMGKEMRMKGMQMHNRGMQMQTKGAPKEMNMDKMGKDIDAMDKGMSETGDDMKKMEMKMHEMDKGMNMEKDHM